MLLLLFHHNSCATILIQNGACLKDPIVEVICENERKHDDDSDEDEDEDEDEAMDEDDEEDEDDSEDDSNKRGKKRKKKKGTVKVMKAWKVKGDEDKVKKETINKTPLLEVSPYLPLNSYPMTYMSSNSSHHMAT